MKLRELGANACLQLLGAPRQVLGLLECMSEAVGALPGPAQLKPRTPEAMLMFGQFQL